MRAYILTATWIRFHSYFHILYVLDVGRISRFFIPLSTEQPLGKLTHSLTHSLVDLPRWGLLGKTVEKYLRAVFFPQPKHYIGPVGWLTLLAGTTLTLIFPPISITSNSGPWRIEWLSTFSRPKLFLGALIPDWMSVQLHWWVWSKLSLPNCWALF